MTPHLTKYSFKISVSLLSLWLCTKPEGTRMNLAEGPQRTGEELIAKALRCDLKMDPHFPVLAAEVSWGWPSRGRGEGLSSPVSARTRSCPEIRGGVSNGGFTAGPGRGTHSRGKPRPSETHQRSCCVKEATLKGSPGSHRLERH